jgi:hypothetical protein
MWCFHGLDYLSATFLRYISACFYDTAMGHYICISFPVPPNAGQRRDWCYAANFPFAPGIVLSCPCLPGCHITSCNTLAHCHTSCCFSDNASWLVPLLSFYFLPPCTQQAALEPLLLLPPATDLLSTSLAQAAAAAGPGPGSATGRARAGADGRGHQGRKGGHVGGGAGVAGVDNLGGGTSAVTSRHASSNLPLVRRIVTSVRATRIVVDSSMPAASTSAANQVGWACM